MPTKKRIGARDLAMGLLLLLALVHCTQCIFFDNYSFINLTQYENGQAPMPFQGRLAMMPVLKWAHGNAHLKSYAAAHPDYQGMKGIFVEVNSAEKVACEIVGALSLLLIVAALGWEGWKSWPACWWLGPALALGVFYVSYAARSQQNLWYPYDLPHAALFTLAGVALLAGRWNLFLLIFCLDIPMRETSIYLVPCALAVGYAGKQLGKAAVYTGAMTLIWATITIAIRRHYHFNPAGEAIHLGWIHSAVTQPRNWGQLLSIFGFLWLPLWLYRADLTARQKAFVLGALPGIAFSAVFAIWVETRVWCEWNGLVALLLAGIAATRYQRTSAMAA